MEANKMMGLVNASDQKVALPIRDWNAMKLALWRSKVGWEIAERAALEILEQCVHLDGCPGKDDETAACLGGVVFGQEKTEVGCPDREARMNALVVLNAARQFAPAEVRRPTDAPYHAPSREYFSEVITDLMATRAELEAIYTFLSTKGIEPPNWRQERTTPQLPSP